MRKEGKMKSSIPGGLLEPLGLVVANFAILETNLDMGISLLLYRNVPHGISRRSRTLTALLTFQHKIRAFSALYKVIKGEENKDTLADLCGKLEKANKDRNTLMHSIFAAGKTADTSMRFRSKAQQGRGLVHDSQELSKEDITKIADEIATTAYQVVWFNETKILNPPKSATQDTPKK